MEDKKLYDVVALVDLVQRSNLLSSDEYSDFKNSVYSINFFTNRRKVDPERCDSLLSGKGYYNKIEDFLKDKKRNYNF